MLTLFLIQMCQSGRCRRRPRRTRTGWKEIQRSHRSHRNHKKSQEITRNHIQNWLKGNPKMCFFEKSIRIFCHFYQYKIDSQHITMFGSSNQVSKENKNCKDKKICSIYIFIYMFLHSIELSQMVYDRLLLIKVEWIIRLQRWQKCILYLVHKCTIHSCLHK